MASEGNKQFVVQTGVNDGVFEQVLRWVQDELRRDHLRITGYHEVNVDGIEAYVWSNLYNFSRSVAVASRCAIMKLSQIHLFKKKSFYNTIKVQLDIRPCPANYSRPINAGNHLASNEGEANLVIAAFDMLFPHILIEQEIRESLSRSFPRTNISRQMLIFDHSHHMVWYFITSLSVNTRSDQEILGNNVSICAAIYRLENDTGGEWNFPFQSSSHTEIPNRDDKEDEDTEGEEEEEGSDSQVSKLREFLNNMNLSPTI